MKYKKCNNASLFVLWCDVLWHLLSVLMHAKQFIDIVCFIEHAMWHERFFFKPHALLSTVMHAEQLVCILAFFGALLSAWCDVRGFLKKKVRYWARWCNAEQLVCILSFFLSTILDIRCFIEHVMWHERFKKRVRYWARWCNAEQLVCILSFFLWTIFRHRVLYWARRKSRQRLMHSIRVRYRLLADSKMVQFIWTISPILPFWFIQESVFDADCQLSR